MLIKNQDFGKQKKIKQLSGKIKEQWQMPQGFAGTTLEEATSGYLKTGAEKVLGGFNNSFVILGRDREGGFGGKGGEGATHAGCIDLIAGLSSSKVDKDGNKIPG